MGGFGNNNTESVESVPYALLKAARNSGQLNLSSRGLSEVPEKVWKINVDIPEEAKNVSLASGESERWWDQVDLRKLILASNQLVEIPSLIKHLPALTLLDAHDNSIKHIAEEIGELRELTKLSLNHNDIDSFPESFCQLDGLVSLNLNGNKIVNLPEDIGFLCKLEEINLSDNKLTALPESFGNLKRLIKLNLSKNQITCLPVGFDNLTSLKDLDISSNKLEMMPAGFGALTSLEVLECRYNFIKKFSAFERPANIHQLFLGYNRIQAIDDDVFEKLPYLVTLDIRDNAIGTIPTTLTQLKRLERIDLSNNSIGVLPYEIGQMNLKSLSLDGNPLRSIRRDIIARGTQAILEYLRSRMPIESTTENQPAGQTEVPWQTEAAPQPSNTSEKHKIIEPTKQLLDEYAIATTKVLSYVNKSAATIPENVWLPGAKITHIDFSKNTLTSFPEEIFQYGETISEVNLSWNKMQCVPPGIASLTKLTFIDFSRNMLTDLPEEFKQFVHLLQVNLASNRFSKIPTSLYELPKLQTLLMTNNQLTEIDVEGLMQLKTLHSLDVSNNSIGHVPPTLGNVEWLKNLQLEGNIFRNPRPALLGKGTQFLLSYLRDRIPQ